MKDADVIHKATKRWNDDSTTQNVFGDRARYAVGRYAIACNPRSYAQLGEVASRLKSKTTCKNCLRVMRVI